MEEQIFNLSKERKFNSLVQTCEQYLNLCNEKSLKNIESLFTSEYQ